MFRILLAGLGLLCAGLAHAAQDRAMPVSPPTLADLFAPPAIDQPQLSPSGRYLLYLRQPQPGESGDARQLVVSDLADPDAPATLAIPLDGLDVRWAGWANDERILISVAYIARVEDGFAIEFRDGMIYLVDRIERTQVIALDRDGSNPVQLLAQSRFDTTLNANLDQITDFLPGDREHILMPARSRRAGTLDLYRVNVYTGDVRRAEAGRSRTLAWFTNRRGDAVMRLDASARFGSIDVLVRAADGHLWRNVERFSLSQFGQLQNEYEWVARAEAFDEALVYARSPQTGTMGLFRYSFGLEDLVGPVFVDRDVDIAAVHVDPFSMRPLYVRYEDTRPRIHVEDGELARHLSGLQAFFGEDMLIEPLQVAGGRVLLNVSSPEQPSAFYLYRLAESAVTPIGPALPQLVRRDLAAVEIYPYTARDGTALFGYLTVPVESHGALPPLVVLPHGGPERRDSYGFDPVAQLLAAEGYMVFQPQFRGSYGFGEAFAQAGYAEWGGRIQDDITDGVRAVLADSLADRDKVCIFGFSFGGYSALMGPIRETDLYRCAISAAGVSDLFALVTEAEAENEAALDYLHRAVGHPERDAQRLAAHSPALRAGEIGVPVLLLHGREDRVVAYAQSEAMEAALLAAGKDVTFIANAGGHHFEDRDLFATMLFHVTGFLRRHIPPPEPPPPPRPWWMEDDEPEREDVPIPRDVILTPQ
ncbi:prolyl oligopeptidase family serine peptidase [Marinicauda algicola]|uniref:S9 family peptidase n=1 Tax=Marinicauda algicola TaxID=2029849 RepID=UPI00130528DC|nr:prolyl oligopeptidase family serine peptidase [Marinicauda algicola]